MKLELLILSTTIFLMYNAYHDGKYIDMIKLNVKYAKIFIYGAVGFGILFALRKNPTHCKSLLFHANDYIKYMPIDKNVGDLITPVIDYTRNNILVDKKQQVINPNPSPSFRPSHTSNRCVSNSKKKYVASQQQWKCRHCNQILDHTYEIDHITELQDGGTNDVSNLVALCRNCHGKKTYLGKL